MSFEKYYNFYEDYENGVTVRPQKTVEFNFSVDVKTDKKYRLFVVGETATYYLWKNEPDTPTLYRLLTDALDSDNANQDQFCLDLSCKKAENYIKRVYKKVMWKPVLSYLEMANLPTDWKAGISVKAEDLKISDDGFLRMRVDVRLKKEGVSRHSIHNAPDKTIIIDLPTGTYDWQKLVRDIEIPLDTAHVGVFVEGRGYSGKVWVERPILSAIGQNLLPDFAPSVVGKEKFEWTAQFLSRKEWPEFEVKLNGQTIFCDEVFERCHTCSEWEIDLPKEYLKGNNKLEIKLISSYHDPLPYCIKELGVIEQPDAMVSIISNSTIGTANGKAYVLLHTNKPNTTLKLEYLNENLGGKNEYFFEEAGYHGVSIDCENPCSNAEFKITCGETVVNGKIDRIVIKENDDIITGTGRKHLAESIHLGNVSLVDTVTHPAFFPFKVQQQRLSVAMLCHCRHVSMKVIHIPLGEGFYDPVPPYLFVSRYNLKSAHDTCSFLRSDSVVLPIDICFDHLRRISCQGTVGGYRSLCDHSTGSHYTILMNFHTLQNHGTGAHPYMITNMYIPGGIQAITL